MQVHAWLQRLPDRCGIGGEHRQPQRVKDEGDDRREEPEGDERQRDPDRGPEDDGHAAHAVREAAALQVLAQRLLVLALFAVEAFAQSAVPLAERYVKTEHTIAVRDGVELYAAVYSPVDAAADRTYPILMKRTPYSCRPYGPDAMPDRIGPSPVMEEEGYIIEFMTEPLEEDLTLAGPILARLMVSTTGTDADWVVKLIDVYPGVDTERFRPVESSEFRARHGLGYGSLIGYTGRHGYEKCLGDVVDAVAAADVDDHLNFDAFLRFLRTDPRFYAESPEELLKENAVVLKRMDGKLPELFATLPRTPYGIRAIPDYLAPRMTTAYYRPPAGDGSTAGFYYINTSRLDSRPLYEVPALAFHEAVPGHHLQNALALELGDVPEFRRHAGFTAFGEGWALYAERLGLEVGFYDDPYTDFGRLSYEMWRALRLVVDTGIHWKGWGRQKAIDFMAENSALALHNIEAEVDRYISWPGQALGYKMGEIAIRELRARSEERLGEAFDIRAFHDVVLGSGEVPLDVLEENVQRWVAGVLERDG